MEQLFGLNFNQVARNFQQLTFNFASSINEFNFKMKEAGNNQNYS